MIRRVFKKNKKQSKIDKFIKKYNIPREYLSVNRKAVTKGLLVGIFWGFIPMPFQMLAVLACTPLLKFNVPLAISMVWLSNPITMPFMYYIEYLTGALLLGKSHLSVELNMQWFEHNLENIFVPLYTGALLYAIVVSIAIFYGVNWLWIYSVKKEKRHAKRKKNNNK